MKTLRFTHIDDLRSSISTEEDNVLVIQTTEADLRSSYEPVRFFVSFIYGYARALLDNLHIRNVEQDGERFPIFWLRIWDED